MGNMNNRYARPMGRRTGDQYARVAAEKEVVGFGALRNDSGNNGIGGGNNNGNNGNEGGNGGCNCGCNCPRPPKPCRECEKLMRQIQQLDFTIQEIVLYLDAYPDCCEAKSFYCRLVKDRKEAVAEYEEHCGPLTMYGNVNCARWDWIRTPWPWEMDFPGDGERDSRASDRRDGCCRKG